MKGVFQRGNTYYISYNVNRVRCKEKIGPSKKLAETVLAKRKVEIAEGRFLDIQRCKKIKFPDFAQEFIHLHASQKKSEKSHFANSITRLNQYFGSYNLHEITALAIEGHKAQRRKEVAPATVNRELACLKSMLNKAIHWGYLKENPVRKVKLFKENNQRNRYLEKEEIEKLLGVCSPRLRAAITFAINTGMRKGEMQNLKWHDIDYANGIIGVHETKNGESRYISMNQNAKDILLATPKHPESPYVFCKRTSGKPYNFRKSFETARTKAGINNFRWHDLRHTFASHLVMAGVDLNTVRELLGHKSLDMTLRYSHLSQDHKNRAVQVLQAKLGTNQSQIGPQQSNMQPASKSTKALTSEMALS